MAYADDIWNLRAERAISYLGPAIVSLGVALWKSRMLFAHASDRMLKKKTEQFPIRIKSTEAGHPLFVIETVRDLFHRVCPCTSKYSPGTRYIRAGCTLEDTNKVMSRTSFILEKFAFNIPPDEKWIKQLRYLGRVPENCINKGV